MTDPDFVCGSVAVLGKPNVGKSTFLNAALGQKIAIVSPRPQTTRDSMAGVYQDDQCQIVFYDTPGIHQPKNTLSKYMLHQVEEVLKGVDAALFLLDSKEGITGEEHLTAGWLKNLKKPIWFVLNKTDQVTRQRLDELARQSQFELGKWPVLEASALLGKGVKEIIIELKKSLPHHPPLFPEGELTDKTLRDLAGEAVREQCFLRLQKEIPYGVAVRVEEFQEKEPPQPVVIKAVIYVEKESQKGIVIGAGGKQLKAIGVAARGEIEKLMERQVFLELWVKVLKNWRKNEDFLKRLGYFLPKK